MFRKFMLLAGVVGIIMAMAAVCGAVQVDGYCYLENQVNHSGTRVVFRANSPGAITDSAMTNLAGYYQIILAAGIYDVRFAHYGFLNDSLPDQILFSNTTLRSVTLQQLPPGVLLSGSLSGILQDTTYLVIGNIFVENGSMLTILPGATLIFYELYSIPSFIIAGILNATGNQQDSVKFLPYEGMNWAGLFVHDAWPDSSRLEYCVITGSNSNGLTCDNSDPIISHCTITQNAGGIGIVGSNAIITSCIISENGDAGILCEPSGSPLIDSCLILDNNGGGIKCLGPATIRNCTIYGNFALDGAGILCSASAAITNCMITRNSSLYHGAGIKFIGGSAATMDSCTIMDNSAGQNGGGIYGSCAGISRCIISGNHANWNGGGIWGGAGIEYCTITMNTAGQSGGGLYWGSEILNCTISMNSAGINGGGIYSPSSILNTIVEGNRGNGGIYFASPNSVVSYSDFSNNENGSFAGSIPQWLGLILTVNANGDSCDAFLNIFEDPIFLNPAMGDFHLQSNSPCIDAGDPHYPLDPDSTIADIGAFFYDQAAIVPITLSLEPMNPPIQIPSLGGNFNFEVTISNSAISPVTFDAWIMVLAPNQVWYGPMIALPVTMAPGSSLVRLRTQNVPATAPSGEYRYEGRIGIYPDTIWTASSFPFTKLGSNRDWLGAEGWISSGEPFPNESVPAGELHPSSFILHPCSPNPFNPVTAISYQLSANSFVSLRVYDTAGRLVATLVDGWREAGSHKVTFDASGLAGGIYFARLEAGEYVGVEKLVLLK